MTSVLWSPKRRCVGAKSKAFVLVRLLAEGQKAVATNVVCLYFDALELFYFRRVCKSFRLALSDPTLVKRHWERFRVQVRREIPIEPHDVRWPLLFCPGGATERRWRTTFQSHIHVDETGLVAPPLLAHPAVWIAHCRPWRCAVCKGVYIEQGSDLIRWTPRRHITRRIHGGPICAVCEVHHGVSSAREYIDAMRRAAAGCADGFPWPAPAQVADQILSNIPAAKYAKVETPREPTQYFFCFADLHRAITSL